MAAEAISSLTTFRVGPRNRAQLRRWRESTVAAAIIALNLAAGFSSIQGSVYWSRAQVFGDFMNSPIRVLFPIAVALVAGLDLSGDLSQRYIVTTRTRQDIRLRLLHRFASVSMRTFTLFALVVIVNAVAAFVIVPTIWPHAVDASQYGFTSAHAVQAADTAQAPLSSAMAHGWLPFTLTAAIWLGCNAVTFGLLTLVSVLIIHRAVLALLVPAGLYLVESVALQILGVPGASFLISAVYPSGLQNYDLLQAMLPSLLLLIVTAGVSAILIARARTSPRLS
jgi:hypothetical protein